MLDAALVRGDRRIHVTLRGERVAETDVRLRVERTQLDGLGVRLDGFLEEPPRSGQVQITQGLVGFRVGGVELGGGAELRGRLPAIAEILVDHPERVLGGDELRIRLDGAAQELDRRLAAVLRRPVRGLATAHVELVGAQLPGGRRPFLDPRQLHLARGGSQRLQVTGG